MYLFLTLLDLLCCGGFSLIVVIGAYFLAVVHGLLTAVASLVAEHGVLGHVDFSICSTWAL